MKKGLSKSKVLISLAEDDIYLPLKTIEENAAIFHIPDVTENIVLPGGHKAIFLEKGAKAFYDWTVSLDSA